MILNLFQLLFVGMCCWAYSVEAYGSLQRRDFRAALFHLAVVLLSGFFCVVVLTVVVERLGR